MVAERPRRAHLTYPWESPAPDADCGVVVVDLFRATSTIQILIDSGCTVRLLDRPPRLSTRPPGIDRRIGEWAGRLPTGMDCGNSPVQVKDLGLEGEAVEFLSSNGAGVILSMSPAGCVICASLFNVAAIVRFVQESKLTDWWLVPAGSRGTRHIEDDYVCARIARDLSISGFKLTRRLRAVVEDLAEMPVDHLLTGRGAQLVLEREGPRDLEFILHSGYRSPRIPLLQGDTLVSVLTSDRGSTH